MKKPRGSTLDLLLEDLQYCYMCSSIELWDMCKLELYKLDQQGLGMQDWQELDMQGMINQKYCLQEMLVDYHKLIIDFSQYMIE